MRSAMVSMLMIWVVGCGQGAASDVEGNDLTAAAPFDPASCQGAAISDADALARFAPGAGAAQAGRFSMVMRERTCTNRTGCTAWRRVSRTKVWEGPTDLPVDLPMTGD